MHQLALDTDVREVRIASRTARLHGDLFVPTDAVGLVLFIQDGGSGRHHAANRQIARIFNQANIATLLFDLVIAQDVQADLQTREHHADLALLTRRAEDATSWAMAEPALDGLPLGYFASGAGSAAAFIAAAQIGRSIAAVVSQDGRPDLAGTVVLQALAAPTLLIVSSQEASLKAVNELALPHLRKGSRLAVVEKVGDHVADPSRLDAVAGLAADWFVEHLARRTKSVVRAENHTR